MNATPTKEPEVLCKKNKTTIKCWNVSSEGTERQPAQDE